MTQDEIIEMAKEADLHATLHFRKEQLRKFAKLVAAKEREACAKVIDAEAKETGLCAYYAQAIRARGEA